MANIIRENLIVNKVFSAKRKRNASGFMNDRQIIWTDGYSIQYDSPTVKTGQDYPIVTIEKFLNWANKEVTSLSEEWRRYE